MLMCCMVHKILSHKEPRYLSEELLFREEVSQRSTHHGYLLNSRRKEMKIPVCVATKRFKWNLVMMLVRTVNYSQEPDTDDITPKVSHSNGPNAINAAIYYIEQ
ncbi:hypothetical protein J6590_066695 [Homalodisca vitripennis]|nr:hypothetical protein J6590_066695 [Homalodisca vitripennis]